MGKRLDVNILGQWMDAILTRVESTHPESNWQIMMMLGEAMVFPSFLAPDNDDQPHG